MFSLFGKKYKDEEITLCAENALELETMVNSSNLVVVSEQGVVKLEGRTANERDKSRAVDTVFSSLQGAGIKFERIEDHINVAAQAA